MSISPFAQSYIRTRTADRMDDTCMIWTAGAPVIDPVTGKSTRSVGTIKYTGKCRFWEVTGGPQVLVGDEQVTITQSFLSVPFDAPVPESDDIVQITASADPDLVGRTVNILSITRGGGLRASRVFRVQLVDSKSGAW